MAGTFVFTDTIKHTFDGLFGDVYSHTSAVVRAKQPFTPGANFTGQRRLIDADLVDLCPGGAGRDRHQRRRRGLRAARGPGW